MSYAPDEDVDEHRIAEHEAERDLAPSDKVGEILDRFNKDFVDAFQKVLQNKWDYKHYERHLAEKKAKANKAIQDIVHQKQVEAVNGLVKKLENKRTSGNDMSGNADAMVELALDHLLHLRKQT